MWIAENLSKNSINKPTAESGNVVMSEIGNNAIIASGEHIGLDFVTPYGIVSIPPVKEKSRCTSACRQGGLRGRYFGGFFRSAG